MNAASFEVKKIWKGTNSSQVIIYTSFNSCTFPFAEGGEYLVFSSYRGEEKLETSMCSGTKKVDLKGDMVNGFSWWQVVTLSIGLLLIVALVIFIVRRTRKK